MANNYMVLPSSNVIGLLKFSPTQIGPGLTIKDGGLQAYRAGVLMCSTKNHSAWIETAGGRYVPAAEEGVIGQVTAKHAEGYRVDIGSAQPAQLGQFAFENATKKNRPVLSVGDLVYARVSLANKYMDPELECTDKGSGLAAGFGGLKGGYMIKVSLGMARRLLEPSCPVLGALGAQIPFETAIGRNGRVWINSGDVGVTCMIARTIQESEYLTLEEQIALARKAISTLKDRGST